MKRWGPLLLLGLAPLLPLWHAVFFGEAIGPFDQVRQMAPWNGPKPAQPWDVLQADAVLQFYPWRDMVFSAWRQGQLPLWNPYEMAGTPLLANSQSGGFYPLHILVGLLHLPTALGITLLAWFHLAWAGVGVFFLTKRLGGRNVGATVAGLSFSLSPFMLGWTGLASVITTVSWIPWILACIAALVREPAERRRTALTGLALAASVAMMLLGGHLQFSAYGIFGALLFGIALVVVERPKAGAMRITAIALFGFAGVMLSLPQLLPVLDFGRNSDRINKPTEEGYDAYIAGSIKPFELGNIATPYALGSPREPLVVGNGVELPSYWPALAKRGANLSEGALTIGPLLLAALFLVPWRDRLTWPIAAVGGIALFLAMGTALNYPLYFFLPGWSATGSPGRIVFLFVLAACVLGGLALSRGFQVRQTRSVWVLGIGGILVALALTNLTPILAPTDFVAADQLAPLVSQATKSIFPLLLVGCLLAAAALSTLANSRLARYRAVCVGVPLLLCALGYGLDIVMTGAPLERITGADPNTRYAFQNDNWSLVTAVKAVAPANLPGLNRIHEISGYDSIRDRDSVAVLRDVDDGKDPAPEANGNMMFVKPSAQPYALADAGVTGMWSAAGQQPLPGPGRFVLPGGSVKVVDEGFDHLELTAAGQGTLTVKDRMMDGWSARVGGKITSLPPGRWRVVDLGGPGRHTVRFSYTPPGLKLGLTGFALALIGLLLNTALALRGKEPA